MKNILVVEDDAHFRNTLQDTLEIGGYNVLTAQHGLEALALLKLHSIDLIFLDIQMPVMDGVEFLEQMRKEDAYKELPVVVVSSVRDSGLMAGVQKYLKKPADIQDILDAASLYSRN